MLDRLKFRFFLALITPTKTHDRSTTYSRKCKEKKSHTTGRLIQFWRFWVILSLGLAPYPVLADERDEVPILGEVVVTATREEEEIRKIPANVTVITAEEIENSNARTAADLLRSEESIVVRDLNGNGKNIQVDLRGFGETAPSNTLVLVDGRRVNEIDLSGVDWTQIPLDQIERIEIVRGTGSVLFGDNAVGGVINIITKTPAKELAIRVGTSAGSYGRIREEASISGGYGNMAATLSGSYDSTNGYRENSEFRTRDAGGKIIYDPTDFLSFSLSGSYHRDNFGLPGPLSEEQLQIDRRAARNPFDEGESTDQYLMLGMDWDLEEYGTLISDLSYRDRESQDDFVSFSSSTDRELDTWGFTPRYTWDGEILDRADRVIAGIDIYGSTLDVDFFFGTPRAPSGFSDIEKHSYGFYVNNEFSLLENVIFTLGARHERVEYDLEQEDFLFGLAPLDDTVRDEANAYSVGLTLLYDENSSIFARVNRSFRFPLTDELILFDFFTGSINVNSDIKPQRGRHYEVGIRHFFTSDVEGNLTLFRAQIRDEIFFNPATFTNVNHEETLHQGVEIGAISRFFDKVTLFGNYTFERATFEKEPFENNDVPLVPRHKANVGFQIYNILPGFILSGDYHFVGSSFLVGDQANQFEKLSKYYTLNGRLSYQWKWLEAFVGVNNVTNQEFSEYAVLGGFPTTRNFYPSPERNWVAGLEATF
ncbi:MAG: TonB-dependent receptor [Proteobacteria bacterium]|nr:TonB-dependent receptor [Pseudomonadota bacterium]